MGAMAGCVQEGRDNKNLELAERVSGGDGAKKRLCGIHYIPEPAAKLERTKGKNGQPVLHLDIQIPRSQRLCRLLIPSLPFADVPVSIARTVVDRRLPLQGPCT